MYGNRCIHGHVVYDLVITILPASYFFSSFFFFFNDTATTEIYTLSLHDALPISYGFLHANFLHIFTNMFGLWMFGGRSEEHTSELQSHVNLVCRLLLEKKKKKTTTAIYS